MGKHVPRALENRPTAKKKDACPFGQAERASAFIEICDDVADAPRRNPLGFPKCAPANRPTKRLMPPRPYRRFPYSPLVRSWVFPTSPPQPIPPEFPEGVECDPDADQIARPLNGDRHGGRGEPQRGEPSECLLVHTNTLPEFQWGQRRQGSRNGQQLQLAAEGAG